MSIEAGIIAEVVFRCLLYAIGCVGNILVIFFILMLREDKKVTHWYVLQLALADFIFLQTLPFRISEILHQRWIYPVWACQARQTVLFFNYYSSTIFLMIMGLDRYLAVCHGLSSVVQKLRSNKAVYIVTVCTWLASLLLCIPTMLYSDKVGVGGVCTCELQFPRDIKIFCETMNEELDLCIRVYSSRTQVSCLPPHSLSRPATPSSQSAFSAANSSSTLATLNTTAAPTTAAPAVEYDGYDYLQFLYGDETGGNETTETVEIDAYDYLNSLIRNTGDTEESSGGESVNNTEKVNPETNRTGTTHSQQTGNVNFQRQIANGCQFPRHRPGMQIFVYFNFIVMFLFPLMVITVCYTLISLRLSKTMAPGRRKSSAGESYHSSTDGNTRIVKPKRSRSIVSSKSQREKKRVTVLCLVLVSLFVFCWLPFHSVNVALVEGIKNQSSNTCQNLAKFAAIFAYLNSALNPYLYNFLGTFRKKLRQVHKTSAMQSFLSATGMTRIGRRASENITSGSESANRSRRSTALNEQSVIPAEGIPLNTINKNDQ